MSNRASLTHPLDEYPERTRSLISYHARRLMRLGIGDGFDDLVQELSLRLWVASRRYDPLRGSWSAFATATLRNAARMLAREQFAAKRQRLRSIGARDPCDPRGDADRLACERRRDVAVATSPPRWRRCRPHCRRSHAVSRSTTSRSWPANSRSPEPRCRDESANSALPRRVSATPTALFSMSPRWTIFPPLADDDATLRPRRDTVPHGVLSRERRGL